MTDELLVDEGLGPVLRLDRDTRQAARALGRTEARELVDMYYRLQQYRIQMTNQSRSLVAEERPHGISDHFATQVQTLERQMVSVLDEYSLVSIVGQWSRSVYGIGPVIAAGFLAHIDIRQAPTVGHIWRFAGLDPTVRWEKGQRRPWNAKLKTLCWKAGDSFVKFSGRDECYYGQLYRQRKEYELARDASGGNAETAATTLDTRTFRDAELKAVYESGHLPPGRLDLRARRWAVKLFLAHWHEVAYEDHFGEPPPLPYPIAHLGHAHKIERP